MAEKVFSKGDIVSCDVRFRLAADVTPAQLQEWLDFEMGWNAMISNNNPLIDCEPDSIARPRYCVIARPQRPIEAQADKGDDRG